MGSEAVLLAPAGGPCCRRPQPNGAETPLVVHLSEFEANFSMCRQQPGVSCVHKYVTIGRYIVWSHQLWFGVESFQPRQNVIESQHRYSIDKYILGVRASLVGCYIICGRREDVRFENHDPFGCSEWGDETKVILFPRIAVNVYTN